MTMSEESRKEFNLIRSCLNKKVSWRVVGAVIGVFSIVAMLSFTAYSGGQVAQTEDIRDNSKNINLLNASTKVIEKELCLIREQIKDAKDIQKISFDAIMNKLNTIQKKRGGDDE